MNCKGKKLNVLGDSITAGVFTSGEKHTFCSLLKERLEFAEVRNYGSPGSPIAAHIREDGTWSEGGSFYQRALKMDLDADVVMVFGGTNDFGQGDVPLGSFEDRTLYSFYGACHKLFGYLIEAFRKVDTKKKLVIAGGASDTGEYLEQLKQQAAGDERIQFVGFVQGQLLEELYSNAYLYVLPSDLEGMPLSLMEAMSFGNCCLTSDIDECAQVIEDHGVTFRHGDPEDLRQKLQQLCDDPLQVRSYQLNASDFICSKYSWDEVCKRTLALYEETKE